MKSYFKRERNKNVPAAKRSPLPLQGAITSSFLSRWSLWHLTWQRRHSKAGGGLKTCHRGLAQASQLEGKWYSVGMNSWPLCGRQLVLSPWRTGSMSASFLHSPSLAYRICRRTETRVSTPPSWTQPWRVTEHQGRGLKSRWRLSPGISWESPLSQLCIHLLV